MRRVDKLLPASFKGVSFLVKTEGLSSGGRRIVLHDYPNSDHRYVEDLGSLPPIFKLDAFVHGTDWRERAEALEQALNQKGPGKLVMPTFGARTIYALPYSKDTSQQRVGIISFSLEFAVGRPANSPTRTQATTQDVFSKGDAARKTIQDTVVTKWQNPSDIDSIVATQNALTSFAETASDAVRIFVETDTLSDIDRNIDFINTNSQLLIKDADSLANNIIQGTNNDTGLWQNISLGFADSGLVSALLSLCSYGAELQEFYDVTGASIMPNIDDETSDVTPYWPETTAQRILRNANRRLLVRVQRINAMIAAYEQAAIAVYQTTVDIENTRARLEQVYNDIMLDGTNDVTSIQSVQSVRMAVEDVRLAALDVIEQKEQQSFGTVTINKRSPISQFALAYNLYAEDFTDSELLTQRAAVIRQLNPEKNGIALSGDLEVLQSTGI